VSANNGKKPVTKRWQGKLGILAKRDKDGLTPKERMFIKEWLSSFNAVQSAIKAGYGRTYGSSAVAGHDLLKKPKIRAILDRHLRDLEFGQDQVKARLADLTNNGPGNLMRPDGTLDIRKMRAKPWLVESYQAASKNSGEKITTPSSLEALKTIAHYHGMLKGTAEVSGTSGPTVIVVRVKVGEEERTTRAIEVESEPRQIEG
jgi:hypothetical protein